MSTDDYRRHLLHLADSVNDVAEDIGMLPCEEKLKIRLEILKLDLEISKELYRLERSERRKNNA